MADRTGKCVNFGLCSKADSREVVSIAGGDFSCPECGKPLRETAGAAAAGGGTQPAPNAKKAVAVGALGLVLVAGAAYKFLVAPDKPTDKTNNGQNVGVINPPVNPQNPTAPTQPLVPGDPNAPVQQNPQNPQVPVQQNPPTTFPPQQNPSMPVQRMPVYPPAQVPRQRSSRPPVAQVPTDNPVETPAQAPARVVESPAAPAAQGTMIARLLSPISTRNSNEGDQFQAKVQNGPYRGQILSGTIKKLGKGKKNAELELEFTALNGRPIPMKLDLTDISNSQGVKGVDDENNRIVGQSSKKKMALVTGIGAGIGAGMGRLIGKSGKATAIGAGVGAGAGFLVSVKVVSHAKDIELNPGSQLTLRESER